MNAMNGTKIIVVYFDAKGTVECFGSIAAIYQEHTPDEIGVAYQTLKNYRIGPDHPYKNDIVTIVQKTLYRMPTNRKRPVK